MQKISWISEFQHERGVSCIYFNKAMQKLLLFNNKLTALEHANEILLNQEPTSHSKPVLCIIYNSLFEVLISADANSVINIWNIATGKKCFT